MYRFQAIIFDVDGTLADTERDGHRPAFNAAFAEAGLDWDWDPACYGELLEVTGGKERIAHFLEQEGIALDPTVDRTALIAALHQAKTRHYLAMLRTGAIPLRPGVLRLLREARTAGLRLAIATTTTPENVTVLLDQCGEPGLRDWFEVIAAGDVVPHKKPAPDIFEHALAELGLKAPDCVAVEDSEAGAHAALAAGLQGLVVTLSAYTEGQDFAGVPLVVDRLGAPDEPATALQGDLGGASYVDLEVLNRVHEMAYPPL
jgi:HAD superfamily hydrolase (TIGR01509 family)